MERDQRLEDDENSALVVWGDCISISSDSEDSQSTSDSEIELNFGFEIELTSSFDGERIKSFYKFCSGSFNSKTFEEIELLAHTNMRQFVLYRNYVSCFANGVDPSLFADLFNKNNSLFFVVEERRNNSWTFQSSSACVGTKKFVMVVDWGRRKDNIITFNLEFNEETLLKVMRNSESAFAMIIEDYKVSTRRVIKFDEKMILNWKEDEVALAVDSDELSNENENSNERQLRNMRKPGKKQKGKPMIKKISDQLATKRSGAPKLPCIYPNCDYSDYKFKMLHHYVAHDKTNEVFLKIFKNLLERVVCSYCRKVIRGTALKRHMRSVHRIHRNLC